MVEPLSKESLMGAFVSTELVAGLPVHKWTDPKSACGEFDTAELVAGSRTGASKNVCPTIIRF